MHGVIEFDGVEYSTAGHRILSGVTFSINSGELLALLGRSGSGKTTLLKLINALRFPTAGRVSVEGKSTAEWDVIQLRRRLGYVIQEVGLFPHFTVERNVALVPTLEGWPAGLVRARVLELLELVGLDPKVYASRYPRHLSGGQRQRVGIARALAANPPILLLDEPFGALDPITRTEIQQEFRELHRRLNKTAVFVTHDVREAFLLATRIALMQNGTLVAIVKPDDFRKLDHPEARAFATCLQ